MKTRPYGPDYFKLKRGIASMIRRDKFIIALLLCLLTAAASVAQAQTPRKVSVNFKETTLKNGLRVITVEDHSAPVVSINIAYNVGSRNERQGRTGFAHLFEHMMFKGSENVGSGEHFLLVFNNGGTMNGTTNEDRTVYFEALPANQLDLALFLEADRMKSLAITKDNLDNQRNAVQEERRLGVDNQPYGKSGEVQQELLYDNFAYKHTTIGSMEDLNAATVEDVAQFFKTYYAPNNAVLTLVGDFKTDDALARIKKSFEAIPRQSAPPAVDMTEPEQKAERRATVEDCKSSPPRSKRAAVRVSTSVSSRTRRWSRTSAALWMRNAASARSISARTRARASRQKTWRPLSMMR
jgi:zinc protease